MAAAGGIFGLARGPRSYNRPILADMADFGVLERFRLSRARIQWLMEEIGDELERNTARSCPLSPETQVNVVVIVVVFHMFEKRVFAIACKRYINFKLLLFSCYLKLSTNYGRKNK